ncbi:hypothetical protein [Rubrivivax gelatinosus]|uniref:Uncharacterized protein n=1 Tax=Rubrivivax gelatinosus TaxID=28068 RepID=A0A4R2M4H7_RUBGE|nr:hypothetical protein [Rubrivivax gelatinosus]MBK1689414.1 hypothetical protein [Rubrivivax gelatinosus]TCO99714.1 hypothetical protein EV684_11410 [Rubrivivax gelatinosus]
MAIIMHGSWTLRVGAHDSKLTQRFVVSGADTGNGSHEAAAGTAVFVSGRQWSLRLQHRPEGQAWQDSPARIGFPWLEAGLLRMEVRTDTPAADALVLGCSLPASSEDTLIYGTARGYAGANLFNPARDDLIVIDPPVAVHELCRRFPALYPVIEKLHPERLRRFPQPAADAELTPLVLPTGLPAQAQGLLLHSQPAPAALAALARADDLDRAQAQAVAALGTTVQRCTEAGTLSAGLGRLRRAELDALAELRDAGLRPGCEARPAAGLLLRVQRYERSAVENLGGPYGGTGRRETLGFAITDEQGHYLFRLSREHGAGAGRPDLIVQSLCNGLTPTWESAPYSQVANVQRLDLCIPNAGLQARRTRSGRRAVQHGGELVAFDTAAHDARAPANDPGGRVCHHPTRVWPRLESGPWGGGRRQSV